MTSWPSARIDSLISFVFEVAKQAINKVILLNPSSTDYWLAKGQQKGGGLEHYEKCAKKSRSGSLISGMLRKYFISTIQFGINFYYEGLLAGEWLELLLHESSHYQFC